MTLAHFHQPSYLDQIDLMLLFDVFDVRTVCFLKGNVGGKGIRAESIISSLLNMGMLRSSRVLG